MSSHPSSSVRTQRFQPSVPEDSAGSAPGQWTQLLFSHLQAQSLMSPSLHAHTWTQGEHWHSSYTEKASEDCCAFNSTHMPVLTQNIRTRQPSPPLQLTRIDINYWKHTCCHSLDSKAHMDPLSITHPFCPPDTPTWIPHPHTHSTGLQLASQSCFYFASKKMQVVIHPSHRHLWQVFWFWLG